MTLTLSREEAELVVEALRCQRDNLEDDQHAGGDHAEHLRALEALISGLEAVDEVPAPACLYATLPLPRDRSACADAQLMLDAATRLRNRLEVLPPGGNRREALLRLDRLVMAAIGAYQCTS